MANNRKYPMGGGGCGYPIQGPCGLLALVSGSLFVDNKPTAPLTHCSVKLHTVVLMSVQLIATKVCMALE